MTLPSFSATTLVVGFLFKNLAISSLESSILRMPKPRMVIHKLLTWS